RMSSIFSDHPLITAQDWRADEGLRTVSLEARGLWIEMLMIMHDCEPYGFLMHKGKPMPPKVLAKMGGCHSNKVNKLLRRLVENQVCARESNGAIYSRCMVAKGRESAEKLVSEPEGLSLEDAAPPPTFDDLWGAYPINTRMSRDLALLEWEKLDPRQRRAAFN